MPKSKARSLVYALLAVLLLSAALYAFLGRLLAAAGGFLVLEDKPGPSEAVVVLSTGVEYYPRLIEAARLFREGYAQKVVINGNRKSETLRELEKKGFVSCCAWYEDSLRILALLGVPRDRVVAVSAEDAYDTVSEAEAVGKQLIKAGITRIIITTSKYHTRRSRYIWQHSFPDRFSIQTVAARDDPYSPHGWWKEGRQIRWVLAEYGAWIYYFWKKSLKIG
ncbi:MAG: YdcF family protein [Candidatus Binatota bacterium]